MSNRRLVRQTLLLAVFVAIAVASSRQRPCSAQERVLPIYSLPADGTWVEFDWIWRHADDDPVRGTLRIASVGRETTGKTARRRIEFELARGDGGRRIRQVLLSENLFDRPAARFDQAVAGAVGTDSPDRPPRTLGEGEIRDVLGLGFDAPEARLREEAAKEIIETKLGKLTTRRLSARRTTSRRSLIYAGWLTKDVPFGVAKFEIRERAGSAPERTVFTATITRRGKDAESRLGDVPKRP